MRTYRNILSAIVTLAATLPIGAATFTANQAGLLGNSSTINADGSADYISLAQAAQDYTQSPYPMVSDYTFYIASDLAETSPTIFNTRISNYTLSIRPTAEPRTVSIHTDIPNNTYPIPNAIKVGPNGTHNLSINGSLPNDIKGLIFQFDASSSNPQTSLDHNGIGFTSKGSINISDCILNKESDSHLESYLLNLTPISLSTAISVKNCEFNAPAKAGSGIYVLGNYQAPWFGAQIEDNILSTTQFGIRLHDIGGTVNRNQIDITGLPDQQKLLAGIVVNPNPAHTTHTEITKNRINIRGGVDALLIQGIRSHSDYDYPGELIIQNNMVSLNLDTGLDTHPVMGVTLLHKRADITEVSHNSVYLPDNQTTSTELGQRFHALGVDGVSSNTATFANNMVKVGTQWGSGLFYHIESSVQSDGNVVGITGGAVFATDTMSTYTQLSDWITASSMDTNSQEFDPSTIWLSNDDLHVIQPVTGLAPGVSGLLQYPATEDIDGDPRTPTTSPGADEMNLGATVREWKRYD